MLIVVTTLSDGGAPQPELISRGFAESDELLAEMRQEAHEIVRELLDDDIREIKLLQEHLHDGHRPARLRPHAPAADDPAGGGRGMTTRSGRARSGRR